MSVSKTVAQVRWRCCWGRWIPVAGRSPTRRRIAATPGRRRGGTRPRARGGSPPAGRGPAAAGGRRRQRTEDRRQRADDRYEAGQDALEEGEWARAARALPQAAAASQGRADAAMYWLAYAQAKLAQNADALATLAI